VHAPSSERPVPLKPPRARAAASIESAADAAAAASITPDRAISVTRAEQRGACAAQASEREQEQLRSRAQPTQLRLRASHPTGRSAVHAPSSELSVPPKPPRARAAATIKSAADAATTESVADAAAAASVTPDRAISGARAEQRADCAAQASEGESGSYDRERSRRSRGGERHTRQGDPRCTRRAASGLCGSNFRKRAGAALTESVADSAAAASVTPDWAISGARAEQRAACADQASEGESSSIDQERSRRSRGGERHTRQGDQRCTRRAASGLCRSSLRKRARAASIESAADAAAAASVTPDRAISGARAEQRAACAAQASEREQGQLRSRAQPTQPRRRASHPTGRSAVHAPSSERPVPLKPPKESKSSYDQKRSRRSCGGECHTRQGDQRRSARRAASGLCRPSFRERARAALIESAAGAAAAASVTPDRAISGARAEQRAASAAQASERESKSSFDRECSRRSKSSYDRKRIRRSCGGERHTRQGDQRCTRRAASGLCRSSL
jgi:hypothetical protein